MTRSPCPFTIPDALALLERTPLTLRSLLDRLPATWLDAQEAPATWSPRQVVAHLIEGEKSDWIPRMRWILEFGANKPFPPFDREAHHHRGAIAIDELLDEFADLRGENLDVLRELGATATQLDKRGLHPSLGEVTLRNLLATWVVHDLDHVAQITRVLASRYRSEVGPWDHPDYLGILHWRRSVTR